MHQNCNISIGSVFADWGRSHLIFFSAGLYVQPLQPRERCDPHSLIFLFIKLVFCDYLNHHFHPHHGNNSLLAAGSQTVLLSLSNLLLLFVLRMLFCLQWWPQLEKASGELQALSPHTPMLLWFPWGGETSSTR